MKYKLGAMVLVHRAPHSPSSLVFSGAPHSASSSSIELFYGALCIPHSPPSPFSFLELSVNSKVQDEKFLVDCSIGSASEFRDAGGSSSRRF
ncbi:hypothetical protein MRB53_008624 [Persea americana]|uniref:Uncharacterized protein n=1 Tax=Persea americana TaxID=3435 RepID=A0ACC2MMK5_PERAE|nr:hypothetical protein MRB53_008624 [Persea americana]